MINKKTFLQIFTLLQIAFIAACNQNPQNDASSIRDDVTVIEQIPQVITRIVAQPAQPANDVVEEEANVSDPITLDISIFGTEFPKLDPQTAQNGDGIDLIENLYVGLTRFNPKTQQIEPYLAESWQVSQNGRVWTFNLRQDIFWIKPDLENENDLWSVQFEAAVNAHDVVFSIQRACLRQTQIPDIVTLFIIQGCEKIHDLTEVSEADLAQIGVKALDDRTVQFTLAKPSAYFLTISSLWYLRPLPKNVVEVFPDDWLEPENFVTSGPYFLNPDSRVLQLNPTWPFETEGNVALINYFLITDAQNGLQLWEAKRTDLLRFDGSQDDELLIKYSDQTMLVPNQILFYLGFNFESGVFNEPELRRAFSAAIDRQKLVDEVYDGDAFGMKHLMPPGVIGSVAIGDVGMGYDPDYARLQMAESSFGSCRLMPPIRYLVNSSDLSLLQAEIIRDMWIEELGCMTDQINVEQVQFGTLLANTRADAGDFRPDIWELGWASFYPDANSWVGDLLHCVESENRSKRQCSDIDDLIRQGASEIDAERRAGIYRQIESDLFSRGGIAPIIPLYSTGQFYLVQPWLEFDPNNFGGQQFDRYVIDANLKRLQQSRQ